VYDVDVTGSGLYPVAGFAINSVAFTARGT
jgi:hypothetical protein